jgi:hypothetical protein
MAKNKFSGKKGAGPKPKPAPKQHSMTEALKNVEKIMANGGKHVDHAKVVNQRRTDLVLMKMALSWCLACVRICWHTLSLVCMVFRVSII